MTIYNSSHLRLGVLGGAFNPPTIAHLIIAEHILGPYLDKVIFLPVGDAYPKPELLAAHHRVAMLQEAIAGNPGFSLSTRETASSTISYSYDSLLAIQQENPKAELYFLMGSDHLPGFYKWHRASELITAFRFLIFPRGREEPMEFISQDPWLASYSNRFSVCRDHPRLDISSTLIRQRVAAGASIRYLTPPGVESYIWQHGLYKAP
ncbi:MAG: nicotinate (nicotinamide) nucleotide adenylyltransferase [Symbiobacteriaceae bacterium]|nr:nicotinate (nicotinamide) nucleotide adenylyltransferase [Symbiobacteriaceae bacterium]